jgi:hypothetical protein
MKNLLNFWTFSMRTAQLMLSRMEILEDEKNFSNFLCQNIFPTESFSQFRIHKPFVFLMKNEEKFFDSSVGGGFVSR